MKQPELMAVPLNKIEEGDDNLQEDNVIEEGIKVKDNKKAKGSKLRTLQTNRPV